MPPVFLRPEAYVWMELERLVTSAAEVALAGIAIIAICALAVSAVAVLALGAARWERTMSDPAVLRLTSGAPRHRSRVAARGL